MTNRTPLILSGQADSDLLDADQPVIVERILQRAGRHHFAFLRAYLEGLNVTDIARRYLENATTARISLTETKLTLQWIRKDLSALAKRHGKYSYARIIALEPDQIQVPDGASDQTLEANTSGRLPAARASIPTLEDYREERDPYEMYSEQELIEMFQQEFGSVTTHPKQERHARLLKKQRDALNWLEAMVSVNPTLHDHVDAWLVPAIASRLIDHGIGTLGSLIALINGRGKNWHKPIAQIGDISAARIVKWLRFYESELGQRVGHHALVKRSELSDDELARTRTKEHGIVPLEYFLARPDMDGRDGLNRGLRNKSGVNDDFSAIYLWLAQVEDNPNTYRSYRKEAERFLLWAHLERDKPLASLMTDDCLAYRNFLRDLGRLSPDVWATLYTIPQHDWMGRRGTERWSTLWRPFENPDRTNKTSGNHAVSADAQLHHAAFDSLSPKKTGALSPSSQKLAHTILKSLCEFLTRQRYLDFNPWDAVKPPAFAFSVDANRSLSEEQWGFVIAHLETLEKNAHYDRLRFLLHFAYGTGMRISEIAAAKLSDLQKVNLAKGGGPGWIIKVVGKRSVEREVAMNSKATSEVRRYLEQRGISLDHTNDDTPLVDVLATMSDVKANTVKSRSSHQSVSVNLINHILKNFFKSAARAKMAESMSDARQIYRASTHWLRHTCGSHAAAHGIDVQIIQSQFGHRSIGTTTIYVTTERDDKIRAFEKL